MRCCEGADKEAAIGSRHHDRPFRPYVVEHGEDVLHQRFDGRRIDGCEALRAAQSTAVCDDHSRVSPKVTKEPRKPWML